MGSFQLLPDPPWRFHLDMWLWKENSALVHQHWVRWAACGTSWQRSPMLQHQPLEANTSGFYFPEQNERIRTLEPYKAIQKNLDMHEVTKHKTQWRGNPSLHSAIYFTLGLVPCGQPGIWNSTSTNSCEGGNYQPESPRTSPWLSAGAKHQDNLKIQLLPIKGCPSFCYLLDPIIGSLYQEATQLECRTVTFCKV